MPNKDKTGPERKGSQTGRGKGLCNSNTDKKAVKKPQVRGAGRCCSRLLDE